MTSEVFNIAVVNFEIQLKSKKYLRKDLRTIFHAGHLGISSHTTYRSVLSLCRECKLCQCVVYIRFDRLEVISSKIFVQINISITRYGCLAFG